MHKWGLAPSPNCECGASEQTADHVLTACPIGLHRAPHGARGLTVLDDETRCWLNDITPASDLGSAAVWGSKRINSRPQSCLCLTCSEYPSNDDDDDGADGMGPYKIHQKVAPYTIYCFISSW